MLLHSSPDRQGCWFFNSFQLSSVLSPKWTTNTTLQISYYNITPSFLVNKHWENLICNQYCLLPLWVKTLQLVSYLNFLFVWIKGSVSLPPGLEFLRMTSPIAGTGGAQSIRNLRLQGEVAASPTEPHRSGFSSNFEQLSQSRKIAPDVGDHYVCLSN